MARKLRLILFNEDGSVVEESDIAPLRDDIPDVTTALRTVAKEYYEGQLDLLQPATRILHMRLSEMVKAVRDLQMLARDPHNEVFVSKVLSDVNLTAAVAILNEVPLIKCVDMSNTYGHQEHTLIGDWFYEQRRRPGGPTR
jgi:hypothetical protein